MDHRELARKTSYWYDELITSGDDQLELRPPAPARVRADVCIVGGGLTGLWTAYYLTELDPDLKIVVLEAEFAGYGASGRNGGWCSALFPQGFEALAKRHGRAAAVAMRRAMIDTVGEVGRVVEAEGIGCQFARGGTIAFARDEVQVAAARAEAEAASNNGVDTVRFTDFAEGAHPRTALAASWTPDCARVQPARLVRGLAEVVERRGVTIYESTRVLGVKPGGAAARTPHIDVDVQAGATLLALEGFGAQFPGIGRRILPLYSLMIATEPLPDSFWDQVGIDHGMTFTDYRHLLIYGQRTADNRFAFGGRGARYHLNSRIDPEYDHVPRVFAHLRRTLDDLFPEAGGVEVTHSWGGPLGVPRDWHAAVTFNRSTRLGFAGGYVGDGLSTTNLAGRTLARLTLGVEDELTALPWVGHVSPQWEPEPLRFIGANAGLAAAAVADVEQSVTKRDSVVAKLLAPLTGH